MVHSDRDLGTSFEVPFSLSLKIALLQGNMISCWKEAGFVKGSFSRDLEGIAGGYWAAAVVG